jgi:hypothetical protein
MTGADGQWLSAGLTQDVKGRLYGTTWTDESNTGDGVVFRLGK